MPTKPAPKKTAVRHYKLLNDPDREWEPPEFDVPKVVGVDVAPPVPTKAQEAYRKRRAKAMVAAIEKAQERVEARIAARAKRVRPEILPKGLVKIGWGRPIQRVERLFDCPKDIEVRCDVQVAALSRMKMHEASAVICGMIRREEMYPSRTKTGRRRSVSAYSTYRHLPACPLKVRLTYPLSTYREITIEPFMRGTGKRRQGLLTVGYVLWCIAREYRRIYSKANRKKYGVWGHGIGDLVFEGLKIHKDGTAEVWIGS